MFPPRAVRFHLGVAATVWFTWYLLGGGMDAVANLLANWQVSLTKDVGDFGEFSLNYDQTDGDEEDGFDEDAKFWVGWSKSF